MAKQLGIDIITVIDGDKYNQRAIIDQYFEKGFSDIFGKHRPALLYTTSSTSFVSVCGTAEQVIGYSTEYRKACYEKLIKAIQRSVSKHRKSKIKRSVNLRAKCSGWT